MISRWAETCVQPRRYLRLLCLTCSWYVNVLLRVPSFFSLPRNRFAHWLIKMLTRNKSRDRKQLPKTRVGRTKKINNRHRNFFFSYEIWRGSLQNRSTAYELTGVQKNRAATEAHNTSRKRTRIGRKINAKDIELPASAVRVTSATVLSPGPSLGHEKFDLALFISAAKRDGSTE